MRFPCLHINPSPMQIPYLSPDFSVPRQSLSPPCVMQEAGVPNRNNTSPRKGVHGVVPALLAQTPRNLSNRFSTEHKVLGFSFFFFFHNPPAITTGPAAKRERWPSRWATRCDPGEPSAPWSWGKSAPSSSRDFSRTPAKFPTPETCRSPRLALQFPSPSRKSVVSK